MIHGVAVAVFVLRGVQAMQAPSENGFASTFGFIPSADDRGYEYRLGGVAIALRPDGIMTMRHPAGTEGAATVKRWGSTVPLRWTPSDRRSGEINLFLGSDPSKWRRRLAHFGVVTACDDSGHVLIRVSLESGQVNLAMPDSRPGTNLLLDSIDIAANRISGSAGMTVSGAVEAGTYLNGPVQEEIQGIVVAEDGDVIVAGRGGIDFPSTPDAYDPSYNGPFLPPFNTWSDAIIVRLTPGMDALVFATFLGGFMADAASSVMLASNGDIVVSGQTIIDFPTTPGVLKPEPDGLQLDLFVTRLTGAGDDLVYSTLLGGSGDEYFEHAALVTGDDVIVVGDTRSLDLQVSTDAYDQDLTGDRDIFACRLSHDGTALKWCTYLGGETSASSLSMAVAPDDSVYVSGGAGEFDHGGNWITDYPFTPGAFSESGGLHVSRISADGTQLLAATGLGNPIENAWPRAMTVRADGALIVVGHALGVDWPISPGAYDPVFPGVFGNFTDGFITCFTPDLSGVVYSTAFGTGGFEEIWDVAVDPAGVVTVVGKSYSLDFPTTPGAFAAPDPATLGHPFVSRLSADGRALYYSTLIPGNSADADGMKRCALTPTSSAVVAFMARSTDLPTSPDAYMPTFVSSGPPVGETAAWVGQLSMLPSGVGKYGTSTPGPLGPLAVGAISGPFVGEDGFGLTCSGAPVGGTGFLALSLGGLEQPLQASGAGIWIHPGRIVALVLVEADELGGAVTRLPVPDVPALAGLAVYGQYFWPTAAGVPHLLVASDAVQIIVQR
jgi:hypothetical protein